MKAVCLRANRNVKRRAEGTPLFIIKKISIFFSIFLFRFFSKRRGSFWGALRRASLGGKIFFYFFWFFVVLGGCRHSAGAARLAPPPACAPKNPLKEKKTNFAAPRSPSACAPKTPFPLF